MCDLSLLLVSAVALIDADNRVLISQRPVGKSMSGLWEFPGGKLQENETPEQALIRELSEEILQDLSYKLNEYPVVEDYIKENLGPNAILNDIIKASYALSRLGPHIPKILENYLQQILKPNKKITQRRRLPAFLGGITLGIIISVFSIGLSMLWWA